MVSRFTAFRIAILLIVLALAALLVGSAVAQTYAFQLPKETVDYTIHDDGTVSVEYTFTFENEAWGSPIDVVDVGLPNGNYDINSIRADVDGQPVEVSSDYQGNGSYGVAVVLGSHAINGRGTVHVLVPGITGMIYPDDQKSDHVSSVFGNTYFGSQYVHGNTDLTVTFHFPVGVLPTESIYHQPDSAWPGVNEPQMADTQQGVTYTWHSAQANGSTMYQFGVSFPAKYVPESAITRSNWLTDLFTVLASFLPLLICGGVFVTMFIIVPFTTIRKAQQRKLEYIKPTISAEGQGIKRGLTAVEAAILMALPLDKVLSMILYGVTKKGAVEVLRENPLQVRKADVMPEGLLDYETEFIEGLVSDMGARKTAMQSVFVNLVRSVTAKMKGFGKKETVAYYQSIIDKAWTQVVDANTPDMAPVLKEEQFEWTMADRDFDERSRRVFDRPILIPMWYGRFHPSLFGGQQMGGATSTPSSNTGNAGRVSLPGADLAATMVTGTQTFAGQLIGNINDFTGHITNVTNPVPVQTSTYRSSGGGGGCACACACAGCACACAGGGR